MEATEAVVAPVVMEVEVVPVVTEVMDVDICRFENQWVLGLLKLSKGPLMFDSSGLRTGCRHGGSYL